MQNYIMIEAVNACKNIFMHIDLPNSCLCLKVDKESLIRELKEWPKRAEDLRILGRNGDTSLYLSAKQ